MQKIKQLINKIEQERDTFSKIALVKQLDDEVSKFRKEFESMCRDICNIGRIFASQLFSYYHVLWSRNNLKVHYPL